MVAVRARVRTRLRRFVERTMATLYDRLAGGRRRAVFLDYPVNPSVRHGWGRPPEPRLAALLDANRTRYRAVIDEVARSRDGVLAIPRVAADHAPQWDNIWFSGVDAAALYGLIRSRRPARYVEIGSGQSTRFARRAIEDGGLATRILSVDPQPRAEIDALCDEVIRAPLQDRIDWVLANIGAGDILFIDGSHRMLPNSDATVAFTELLPALPDGVLVHIHDIFLPDDYPPAWAERLYSEQYGLAAMLLAGTRYQPLLPIHYVQTDQELAPTIAWVPGGPDGPHLGGSFWLTVGGAVDDPSAESRTTPR
jgi:predicted O-methyltransferase YrrM